jgi:alkaline phosphatase D
MPHLKTQLSALDRRRFMRHTWDGVTASVALALLPGGELFAASSFGDNPFTLGVASGDPTPDGIVLWTRLAPDPVDPFRLGRRSIPVGWRVATDSGMRHVVARGTARAEAELAHSVHVEVGGLRPGRDYFYQFDVRQEESAVGHFRTLPVRTICSAGCSSRSQPARTGRAVTTPRIATCSSTISISSCIWVTTRTSTRLA